MASDKEPQISFAQPLENYKGEHIETLKEIQESFRQAVDTCTEAKFNRQTILLNLQNAFDKALPFIPEADAEEIQFNIKLAGNAFNVSAALDEIRRVYQDIRHHIMQQVGTEISVPKLNVF